MSGLRTADPYISLYEDFSLYDFVSRLPVHHCFPGKCHIALWTFQVSFGKILYNFLVVAFNKTA